MERPRMAEEGLKPLERIKAVLLEHARTAVSLTNGTFIRPLPGGPLRFLHRLFAGLSDAELKQLQHMSAMSLPPDYLEFMRWSGGADLFDNTLLLFGLRDNPSRSLALEEQGPLSLRWQLELLEQTGRWNEATSWQPTGSVVAATETYSIQICPQGTARIASKDGAAREFSSFSECVLTVALVLRELTGEEGLIDETG